MRCVALSVNLTGVCPMIYDQRPGKICRAAQTPRKGRGRLMESNTFHAVSDHACKPSSNQMARYIIPSRADIKFHELFIRILINPSRERKYRLRYREQIDIMRRVYSIFLPLTAEVKIIFSTVNWLSRGGRIA